MLWRMQTWNKMHLPQHMPLPDCVLLLDVQHLAEANSSLCYVGVDALNHEPGGQYHMQLAYVHLHATAGLHSIWVR